MTDATWPRFAAATTTGAAIHAAVVAGASLTRPMFEDQAVMAYLGFLVSQGWVPYRDFFDMNTAGAHLANAAVGRLTGFGEGGARAVDLAWLAWLLWLTWLLLRDRGVAIARGAVALVAAVYLSGHLSWTLEREALLLPFVAAALLLYERQADDATRVGASARLVLAGFCVGAAATIKPQAAIFLVPLVAHAWWRTRRVTGAACLGLGAVVPLALVLGWLDWQGALPAFVEMASEYWPLYNAIGGDRPHLVLSGAALVSARVYGAITFGLHPALPLVGAAVLGARMSLACEARPSEPPSGVWLHAGMAAAAWVAVIPAAKFWAYHWWPFCYFAVLLGARAFAAGARERWRRPSIAAIVLLFAGISWSNVGPWAPPVRFPHAHVERMTAFLQARAEPGDTVVPLDWIEGALHAMLRARLLPGTPFVYDFHFSHHVSSPYVQELRRRFLDSFDRRQPRFVIRIHRPDQFAGPDTAEDFPALDARLAARYRVALADPAFEILERQDGAPAQGGATR